MNTFAHVERMSKEFPHWLSLSAYPKVKCAVDCCHDDALT